MLLLEVKKVLTSKAGNLEAILWLVKFAFHRTPFNGQAPWTQTLVSVRRDEVDPALFTALSVARQSWPTPSLALLTD